MENRYRLNPDLQYANPLDQEELAARQRRSDAANGAGNIVGGLGTLGGVSSLGAAESGVAGTAGAAEAGGATAATGTGLMSSLLPAAGVVGGAAVGSQQLSGFNNIRKGKAPSTLQSAAMFPIDGGASFAAKALGFGGMDAGKRNRRYAREALRQTGLADASVPSGLAFDAVGGQRGVIDNHQVDYNDPITQKAIALLDPIGDFFAGGDEGKRGDVVAILAKAVKDRSQSEEDVTNNVLSMVKGLGINYGDVDKYVEDNRGKFQGNRYDVYRSNLNQLAAPVTNES
jgi:hypothetical protein